jgi:hypothetical protein
MPKLSPKWDWYQSHTYIVRVGQVFRCPHCGQLYVFGIKSSALGEVPELYSTEPLACVHIPKSTSGWARHRTGTCACTSTLRTKSRTRLPSCPTTSCTPKRSTLTSATKTTASTSRRRQGWISSGSTYPSNVPQPTQSAMARSQLYLANAFSINMLPRENRIYEFIHHLSL